MKTKPVVVSSVLALFAAGVGAWMLLRSPAAPVAEAEGDAPVALVKTAVITEQPLARTVEAFGVVAPSAEGAQTVTAPFDGMVAKVLVAPGGRVEEGAPLVELELSADTRLQWDSARGALKLAERALATAKERYDLKLTGESEYIAAQQTAQEARLKVDSLKARGLGGNGQVVAPVAGVVGRVDASVGTLVITGSPLVLVVSSGGLEAKLGVEMVTAASVRAGQPVELASLDRSTLASIDGRVLVVGASVNGATGEVTVRVALPAGAAFFEGEHLRGRIEVERRTVLAVPGEAVTPLSDAEVLFTVKDGKAVRHEVTTGIVDGGRVEVSGGGVAAGDIVVTVGNHELSDGAAVRTEAEVAK